MENLPKLLLSIDELQCGDGSGLFAKDCVELVSPVTLDAFILCDQACSRKHAKKPEVLFPLHVIGWTLLRLGRLFRNRKSISKLGGTTMMLETKLTQIWWSPNVKGPRTTALFSWTRSLDLKQEISCDAVDPEELCFCVLSYRSGTVNSKSFVGKVFLRIKQKFE